MAHVSPERRVIKIHPHYCRDTRKRLGGERGTTKFTHFLFAGRSGNHREALRHGPAIHGTALGLEQIQRHYHLAGR